jgi:hypothetical protein
MPPHKLGRCSLVKLEWNGVGGWLLLLALGGCFSSKKNRVFDARRLIYMHPVMREKGSRLWFSAFTRSISSSSSRE